MPNGPGRTIKREIVDIIREMREEKKEIKIVKTKKYNNKKE